MFPQYTHLNIENCVPNQPGNKLCLLDCMAYEEPIDIYAVEFYANYAIALWNFLGFAEGLFGGKWDQIAKAFF
jgi:hypothetical protein